MKYVHIITIAFKGKVPAPTTVATVVLDAGEVRIEGDSSVAKELRERGAPALAQGTVVTVADGEAFLRALPAHYRSAYLFATGVQEGDSVVPYVMPPVQKAA